MQYDECTHVHVHVEMKLHDFVIVRRSSSHENRFLLLSKCLVLFGNRIFLPLLCFCQGPFLHLSLCNISSISSM